MRTRSTMRRREVGRAGAAIVVAAALAAPLVSSMASAQSAPAAPSATPSPESRGEPTSPDSARFTRDLETSPPPPSNVVYFQYGLAFAAEGVLSPGPICDNVGSPCILGTGGGIVVRGGWRSTGPLYLGGAYELTKQDPNKLYRMALLQQARGEGRYYFETGRVTEPYAVAGLGVAGYGNEWSIDTWGPTASLGAGLEYQITRSTVVGIAFAYRLLYLSRFTDTAGTDRAPGVAQLFGVDFVLEQRAAVVRASETALAP